MVVTAFLTMFVLSILTRDFGAVDAVVEEPSAFLLTELEGDFPRDLPPCGPLLLLLFPLPTMFETRSLLKCPCAL